MTRLEVNIPPPNSNQTPISFQGIPQHIVTQYPHTIPATDNYALRSLQGIPQHITTYIPPGRGPDTYGPTKKAYAIDTTNLLIGGVVGFALGAIIFTATGRKITKAVGSRTAEAIYRPRE